MRLEILLRAGVEPRLQRTGEDELSLYVSSNGTSGAGSTAPAPIRLLQPSRRSRPSLPTPSCSIPNPSMQAIETVKLGQNGEQTEVNMVGSGKLNYHVTRLQNPDRVVLDFSRRASEDFRKEHRQQSRPGSRHSPRAVLTGSFARGDRSPFAGALQRQRFGNAVTVAFTSSTASAPAPAARSAIERHHHQGRRKRAARDCSSGRVVRPGRDCQDIHPGTGASSRSGCRAASDAYGFRFGSCVARCCHRPCDLRRCAMPRSPLPLRPAVIPANPFPST